MNKRKLSYVLSKTDIEKLEKEVAKIEINHNVSLVKESEEGLVMVKIKDGVYGEKFYIGEILITETSVHLDGALGMGIVQGVNHRKSYLMAVIDAAFNLETFKKAELVKKIEVWEKEISDVYRDEKAMVEGSKVKFNTMGE